MENQKNNPGIICFECKGCKQPAMYFPNGWPPDLEPGCVGHSKPPNLRRTRAQYNSGVTQIKCDLYNRLTAEQYWYLHRDAKRLESPEEFSPLPPIDES